MCFFFKNDIDTKMLFGFESEFQNRLLNSCYSSHFCKWNPSDSLLFTFISAHKQSSNCTWWMDSWMFHMFLWIRLLSKLPQKLGRQWTRKSFSFYFEVFSVSGDGSGSGVVDSKNWHCTQNVLSKKTEIALQSKWHNNSEWEQWKLHECNETNGL